MARNTKRGKCELCGEVANVGTNHGSATCPKCMRVQAALAKRLQAVAKAARAMGKAEDLIKALIPDGGSLAVQVTATLLQEISGIVGYDGEDPAELVEAVRLRALTCASCEAEDVLAELREIVGYYVPDQGDKGLVDAVRGLVSACGTDCGNDEILLRDDLARACDMDQDYSHSWSTVVQNAIHELARLQDRRDYWCEVATDERTERAKLDAKLQDALGKLAVANGLIGEWSAKCDRLEAEAVANKAENARQREQQPESIGLLDVALAVIREEPVPAWKIASLIDAARRAA